MSMLATLSPPSPSAPSNGSRTQIIIDSNPPEDDGSSNSPDAIGVLRLQGGPRSTQRVAWDEDVVDNEGCGRKSSKICCIYHKPHKFDESSDESSDSDSDSDEGPTDGAQGTPHCVHDHANHKPARRDREPNAYERAPSWKGKKKARQ